MGGCVGRSYLGSSRGWGRSDFSFVSICVPPLLWRPSRFCQRLAARALLYGLNSHFTSTHSGVDGPWATGNQRKIKNKTKTATKDWPLSINLQSVEFVSSFCFACLVIFCVVAREALEPALHALLLLLLSPIPQTYKEMWSLCGRCRSTSA